MTHKAHHFQLWLRGILCNVTGYIESADRNVGIMADSFVAETITEVDTGKEMPELSDEEYLELDKSFFESQPVEHVVFEWREHQEL